MKKRKRGARKGCKTKLMGARGQEILHGLRIMLRQCRAISTPIIK